MFDLARARQTAVEIIIATIVVTATGNERGDIFAANKRDAPDRKVSTNTAI